MTVEGDDAGEPATPSLGEPPAEARSIVDEILGDLTEFGRTAAPGSDVERVDKSGESVRQIRENTVTARSRATYQSSYCRFLAWVLKNKAHFITPQFAGGVGDVAVYSPQQLRALVKDVVNQDPRIAPLVFDTLAAEDFATWLVTLKRRDGAELSYSALNNHRAGLFNLFRDFSKTMSKTLELELTTYFKSLKHKLAKDASNGASEIKTGQDSPMFNFYSFLCDTAMLSSLAEQIRPEDGSSDTRFRLLEGRDMPNRKLQKRLSDLRYVMSHIEKDAASKDALITLKKLHMSFSTVLIALQWIRQLHIRENNVVVN
ncbi:hypothetical protein PC112_g15100 [Phytophthora cactorum]|nr:hypothetical protein PC112_g15100 [Phytophthora cactorum]